MTLPAMSTRLFAPSHHEESADDVEHFTTMWKSFAQMAAPEGMAEKQSKKYEKFVDNVFKLTEVDNDGGSLSVMMTGCGFEPEPGTKHKKPWHTALSCPKNKEISKMAAATKKLEGGLESNLNRLSIKHINEW